MASGATCISKGPVSDPADRGPLLTAMSHVPGRSGRKPADLSTPQPGAERVRNQMAGPIRYPLAGGTIRGWRAAATSTGTLELAHVRPVRSLVRCGKKLQRPRSRLPRRPRSWRHVPQVSRDLRWRRWAGLPGLSRRLVLDAVIAADDSCRPTTPTASEPRVLTTLSSAMALTYLATGRDSTLESSEDFRSALYLKRPRRVRNE